MTNQTPRPALLLLDFDGTVCIGDGPVLAYGEATVAGLPEAKATAIMDELRTYLAGRRGARWPDGYVAVQDLTAGLVGAGTREGAYARSRELLAEGVLTVRPAEGLHGFLTAAGAHAERVIVTNAPGDGVSEFLERNRLDALVDRVVSRAAKPAGWRTLLPGLLAGRRASAAVSVGDFYANDIAPLIPLGVKTAFLDRFGAGEHHLDQPSDWSASAFPELYEPLLTWLSTQAEIGI